MTPYVNLCPSAGVARAMMRSSALFWRAYRLLKRPDHAQSSLLMAVAFRDKAKELKEKTP